MRRVLSLFLAAVMLISLLPNAIPLARAESYSGSCGENLTWTLNLAGGDTGTLTISGTGAMDDYSKGEGDPDEITPPWLEACPHMTEYEIDLVLEEGVTGIGNGAFGLTCIYSLSLPSTLEHIGIAAFFDATNLQGNLDLPEGLQTIGSQAFYGCPLTRVVVPESVTQIDDYAFCNNVTGFDIQIVVRNRDCILNGEAMSEYVELYGWRGSTLEDYAAEYDKPFTALDELCGCGKHEYECVSLQPHTAEETGSRTMYCWRCGDQYTEITPAGHVYQPVNCNHWIYTMQCMYCEDSYVEDISEEIAVGESKTVYYPEYEEMWFRFLPEETGFYSLTADLDDYTRWCNVDLYSAEGERIKSGFGGYESGEDLELNLVSRMTAGEPYYYRVRSYDAVIHLNEYQPTLSGSCGPNLSWNMDLDTGLLRIEGSGKMEYQYDSPWNMLAECVTAVSLPEELESIGADAFADCANLEAVSIPERVTEICSNAFYGCNTLREIVIPQSVKRVGENAFDLCNALERVTVKSRDCIFDYASNTLGLPEMTVISGGAHSTACDYASYYGYEFVAIDLCAEGVHDYELVDELAHTDTQEGWKQWRCTECGEEYTEITPAGHVYTCVSSLLCLQTMQCKYCSASYQEDCSEELLPDAERTVSVTAQEPEAWLRFTPEETGFYSLRSNANIDTYAELYQDDGQLLYSDDDGGDNTNFLITYRLQAGRTYYYKVRCYSYGAGSFAVQLSRYEPASSGICGYALNWSFDRESGLLRITGEGEMASAPWEEFWREDITEISLPEKLSSIRYAAFSECTALQELTIPSSVKRIGWEALRGCIALRSVTVLNRRCQIDSQWGTLGNPSQTVIRGGANSTAQEFANSFGQEFEVLDLCAMGSHDYEIQEQQYHTDTEEGWRHWVCAECGAEYTETVPAGHVFTVTAYTDLWNGTKHCIYCDLSVEGDVSEALQPEGVQHFRMPDEGNELWLHFTPEELGVYTLSASGDIYELELYDPAGTMLSSGDWNDENICGIRRAMVPGERYYFRVRSYDDSELSTVQMTKEELVSSGTCGPNLSWRFDLETGLLTVEGTGYMEYDGSAPWADLHSLIRSVSLPQGLRSIGHEAFWNCTLLEEIVIPDSVESIHYGAFSGCSALRSVQLPVSLYYISDQTFKSCTALTELQLPEQLATIGWQAFSESGLTEIRIPSQVQSINENPFEGCPALQEIHVAEENVYFAGVDGVLTDKAMTRLIAYPAGRAGAYTVPEGITVIGTKAFAGAAGLTAVELPESLRRIEDWAFNGCGALSEITIPMGVTEIRSGAFEACSALAGVTILSRDCRIDSFWTTLGDVDVTVIRSGNRSTAHDYAEGNGYRFEAIDLCALGCHAYEVTEQQAHTDAEPGWRVWTCAECGDSYTENTPAGHVFRCTEYSERWNGVLHCIYCDLSMEADASAELQEGSQSVPLLGEGYTLWLRCASQQLEELRLCIHRKEYDLSFMDLYVGDSEEAAAGANWTEDTVELRWLGKPGEVYHVCVGFDRRVDTAALEWTRSEPAYSGACGEKLSWRFDPDTGLLSVEGSGEMDYWESEYAVPWNLFRSLIRQVSLPEGLLNVGRLAFADCPLLESVELPDSVEYLSSEAFARSALGSIRLSEGLKTIESYAFQGCRALTGIQFPAGLERIYDHAFADCDGLTEVTLPASLRFLESTAFLNAAKLTAIHVDENNDVYTDLDGVLTNKKATKLVAYPAGRAGSYAVPESVRRIDDEAFAGVTQLTAVTLPEGLKTIGYDAFRECTGLSEITLPASVETIMEGAFINCWNLSSITVLNRSCAIPYAWGTLGVNEVTLIRSAERSTAHDYADRYGQRFEAIDLCALGVHGYEVAEQQPHTDTEPGWRIWRCVDCGEEYTENTPAGHVYVCTEHYYDWNGLMECVYCDASYEGDASLELSLNRELQATIEGFTSIWLRFSPQESGVYTLTINQPVLEIDLYSEEGDFITWKAGDGVRCALTAALEAGKSYYYRCSSDSYEMDITALMSQTEVPVSGQCGETLFWSLNESSGCLTITGSGAMYDFLGEDGREIPWQWHQSIIRELVLPEGLTSIGSYAFNKCRSLESLSLPSSLGKIGDTAFADCSGLRSVSFNNGLVSIGNDAFMDCSKLESVLLPDSVSSLGSFAFGYDSSLRSLRLPVNLTVIGQGLFCLCESLESVTIPEGVERIDFEAFYGCSALRSITIPASVEDLSDYAFAVCTSLQEFRVDAANAFYGTDAEGVLFSKDMTLLKQYPSGRAGSYEIPEGVTALSKGALMRCDALTALSFPQSLSAVESSAVSNCAALETVTFWNASCAIELYDDFFPADVTVRGWEGSTAETFAGETGLRFQPLDASDLFLDVPATAYYKDAVSWAIKNGVTTGTSEDTFSPNQSCTRAQVMTFLWRAEGCPEPETLEHPFDDLDENAYYFKAVLWAYQNGVTTGVTKTSFGPGAECTRAQVMTFLWRAEGSPKPQGSTSPFTDVSLKSYYGKAVLWAYEQGIAAGTTPTSFGPKQICTRAQAVTFLFRAEGEE